MNLHYITLHYTILHDITWLRQIVYLLSYLLAYLRAYLLTYLLQDPTSIAEATSMTSIVNESSIWRYRLSRAIRWSNGRITHLKTARAVCKKLPLLGQSNRWQDGASILRRGRMLTKVQGRAMSATAQSWSPLQLNHLPMHATALVGSGWCCKRQHAPGLLVVFFVILRPSAVDMPWEGGEWRNERNE